MADDGLLDSMRQTGDPLADTAVAEAFATGAGNRVNDLLVSLHRNNDPVPSDLPPALRTYFSESAVLPAWADRTVLGRAGELWRRYGAHMGTILHAYSLPVSYGWAKAAQVVHRTTRITGQATRRVLETAQFLQDVMAEGGLLEPDGYGRRSAQKIRLMQATIRHFLRSAPDWDGMTLGLAANQEDLAATAGMFAVGIPTGLVKVGVDLPEADRDDCFHLWSVVGHLLGARLMPSSFGEAVVLTDRIWRRQWAPSEAGTALTGALVSYLRKALGPAFRGAPPTLIRHFCGEDFADMLGVPPSDWTALALDASTGLSAAFGQTGDRGELLERVSSKAGERLLTTAARASNRGQRYDWTLRINQVRAR